MTTQNSGVSREMWIKKCGFIPDRVVSSYEEAKCKAGCKEEPIRIIEYSAYAAVVAERDQAIALAEKAEVDLDCARWALKTQKEHIGIQRARIIQLEAEVKRLRTALEFYADRDNWQYTTYDICANISNDDLGLIDGKEWEYGGSRARQALEGRDE